MPLGIRRARASSGIFLGGDSAEEDLWRWNGFSPQVDPLKEGDSSQNIGDSEPNDLGAGWHCSWQGREEGGADDPEISQDSLLGPEFWQFPGMGHDGCRPVKRVEERISYC